MTNFLRALLGAAAALTLGLACTVPSLETLGEKRCELDGGHPCITGYVCTNGLCRIPSGTGGGTCTDGASRTCGSDAGVCRPGTQRCAAGAWGACEGQVGPGAELCDGKDNDCDGLVDDDVTDGLSCPKQQGVCLGSHNRCVDGGYPSSTCVDADYGASYQATESLCDGKDNDCDGTADNGVSGGNCPNTGVCAGAQLVCSGGQPGACGAAGYEATELSCDNKDNDCDGQVDEGVKDTATPCLLTKGVCAGTFPTCVDGGFETVCGQRSYGPNYEVAEAQCDGKDNDCDGTVDRRADGGVIAQGACEYTAGVCAGALRVCVGGNHEAPCTTASYGSAFQLSEFTCDGLDNDCDGRDDRSREARLVASPLALSQHLGLAATPTGVLAVYEDAHAGPTRIYLQAFDQQLKAVGAELELSDVSAQESRAPVITAAGAGYVASWVEKLNGGTERIQLVRLAPDFTVDWRRTVVSPVSIYKDPRITAATSPDRIVVAWIDLPGQVVRAVVYDNAGTVTKASTPLTSILDAGTELVLHLDLFARSGSSELVVGWIPFTGASDKVRFRSYDSALAPTSPVREATSGETASFVRLAQWGAGPDVGAAWLTAGPPARVRFTTNALSAGATPAVAASYDGGIFDLAMASSPQAAVTVWTTSTRLFGATLAGTPTVSDFTPPGVVSLLSPTMVARDGGLVTFGYQYDTASESMDLFAQSLCAP